jgi:hypothetical protein
MLQSASAPVEFFKSLNLFDEHVSSWTEQATPVHGMEEASW